MKTLTICYMQILNVIKLLVIWLTDFVNWCYYPFDLKQTYGLPLQDLQKLDTLSIADLMARFMQPSGEFYYTMPRPADAGDTALFQGIATGMKILRGDDVTNQFNFIKTLFPNNRLIRGYYGDGTMNDTTSNDSASGMLFFFYCAIRFGSSQVHQEASDLLVAWLRQLKADNWSLCAQDGTPTTYGVLDNGILTDPLRVTILLGLLVLGVTCSSEFVDDYNYIHDKYILILSYPKVKFLWWDTKYDTHRAAINLHVLYVMTRDNRYKRGLERIWRITKKENNAWVYTLCYPALDDKSESAFVNIMLSTFDLAKRQLGDLQSINDDQPAVTWPKQLPFGLTTPVQRSVSPLPLNKRGSQDFFWQRDMNSLDEWVGNTSPDVYHSMLDFLVCYNLAKKLGVL
jgi:hypothetical protein